MKFKTRQKVVATIPTPSEIKNQRHGHAERRLTFAG